jgi:hypothetical protein
MTSSAILALVVQFGPTIIPLIAKLVANIQAGKGETKVSDADWAELNRLASQTSADIYARMGIAPPPPSP